MKVKYIGHSSFAVFMDEINILFDYYKGELPRFEEDKPLVVFVSHRHYDHFTRKIFNLADEVKNICYVISDDIPTDSRMRNLKDKVIMLSANCDRLIKIGDIELYIHTYESTDEGLAFIADVCKKRLYHAGDLNYWYWEGEPYPWNEDQEKNYMSGLNLMKELTKKDGKAIDAAFIPLDIRQEDNAYLGIEYFIKLVGAKHIFPMHFNGSYDITDKLKQRLLQNKMTDNVVKIEREGEEFTL